MFGTKSGPGNKGKDGGLQEPNGIFLFIYPIKLVGKPTLQGGRKSQIILSYKLLLATEDLRAMLITQKQSTTISNQFVFKLLMQSSVPSMINLNSIKETHER